MEWNIKGDVISGLVDSEEICQRFNKLLFLAITKEFYYDYIIQSCQDPCDVQHSGPGVVRLHGDLPQVQQSPASLLQ